MKNKNILMLLLIILFSLNTFSCLAQYDWVNGEISIKSKSYSVKVDRDNWVSFKRIDNDSRRDLPLGYSKETGRVSVTIESEREFVEILNEAFSREKLEAIAKEENDLSLMIMLDGEGLPFYVKFRLRPNTQIFPSELIFIEDEIISRVRFLIQRELPFGQPCIYPVSANIKFQDILNGEIPGLKRSEQQGKEKPEWER